MWCERKQVKVKTDLEESHLIRWCERFPSTFTVGQKCFHLPVFIFLTGNLILTIKNWLLNYEFQAQYADFIVCLRREKGRFTFKLVLYNHSASLRWFLTTFPAGMFFEIPWNVTLFLASFREAIHMVLSSGVRLEPFYHYRQTLGHLLPVVTGIHLRKQNKAASCLGTCRRHLHFKKLCSQRFSSFARQLVTSLPPGAAFQEVNIPGGRWGTKDSSCGMSFQRQPGFRQLQSPAQGFITVIICPDLVWNEQKGKNKNAHDSF